MPQTDAKIVSLLDVSESMSERCYLTPVKAGLNTFVNMFQADDRFAVVRFATKASQVYPLKKGLAPVNAATLRESTAAVKRLRAGGRTNIGDAIKMGTALLQGKSEPRAQVLLSDGEWNVGPDPLSVLPRGIRVFTIALGDDGQTRTLRKIARDTGGEYLFAPDAIALMPIYLDLLDSADVGRLVYNGFRSLDSVQNTFVSTVKLAGGLVSASIGVSWADPEIAYVDQAPGPGQVSIQLLDPDFKVYPATPDYQEDGFAVFTIATPEPGDWHVITTYGGGGTANVTVGVLVPDRHTTLALEAPSGAVPAGRPFTVQARITHDGQPVAGCSLAASADQPAVSVEAAILKYRSELACVELPEEMDLDHPRADRVRLRTLRRRKLPAVDILPRQDLPASCREIEPGWFEIEVATLEPGEYLVKVECAGPHVDGGELMRTRRAAVSVR